MKQPDVSKLPDADMQAVPAALRRAGETARKLAQRCGTPLIVVRDGRLMTLDPDTGAIVSDTTPRNTTILDR